MAPMSPFNLPTFFPPAHLEYMDDTYSRRHLRWARCGSQLQLHNILDGALIEVAPSNWETLTLRWPCLWPFFFLNFPRRTNFFPPPDKENLQVVVPFDIPEEHFCRLKNVIWLWVKVGHLRVSGSRLQGLRELGRLRLVRGLVIGN